MCAFQSLGTTDYDNQQELRTYLSRKTGNRKSGTNTADTVYSVMLLSSCQQTCVCVEPVEITDKDKLHD